MRNWHVGSAGELVSFSVDLSSDEKFLANRDVQWLLRARWRHEECAIGVEGGCEVVVGTTCGGPKGQARKMRRRRYGVWEVMAVAVVLLAVALSLVRGWVL